MTYRLNAVRRHRLTRRWRVAAVAALAAGGLVAVAPEASAAVPFAIQSLDGSGNNAANPTWGQSGTNYHRIAPARYADGLGEPVAGPNSRFASNRLHNDANQNLFS